MGSEMCIRDRYLFISISLLSIMGLLFLYSASQGSTETVIKQSLFVVFGLILMFILSQPDPDFYKNNALYFLSLSAFLALVKYVSILSSVNPFNLSFFTSTYSSYSIPAIA